MSDFKEIRSIELASFTTVTAAISVLFSIIAVIVVSILIALVMPTGASIIPYLIPTVIVGSFMITIYSSFSEGLFYNLLAKKLKTVAIKLEKNQIVKISTSETAMMVSIISTIEVILLYLVTILILPLFLSSTMQTLMYMGQQQFAYTLYQLLVVVSQPTSIALMIVGTLIITFVFVLLGTYIYNILGQSGRGIVVDLESENGLTQINSVDTVKLAIAFAIINGVLSIILSLIMIVSGAPITSAVGYILGGFVGGFIEAYLIGLFYNFLVPKIGKIKLELIDFKIN